MKVIKKVVVEVGDVDCLVKSFFVKHEETDSYVVNPEFDVGFPSEKDACEFLVELISFWSEKMSLFCWPVQYWSDRGRGQYTTVNTGNLVSKDEWTLGMHPRCETSAGSCVLVHATIRKIFGDVENFRKLPFTFWEEGHWSFRFAALKCFSKCGDNPEALENVDAQLKKAEDCRRGDLRKKQSLEFDKRFGNPDITKVLRDQVLQYVDGKASIFVQEDSDIVVISEFINGSGCYLTIFWGDKESSGLKYVGGWKVKVRSVSVSGTKVVVELDRSSRCGSKSSHVCTYDSYPGVLENWTMDETVNV